tara:strand:- start:377 stop:1060 length:684 start_codon:yes stop_codon:yes gene_type:complete
MYCVCGYTSRKPATVRRHQSSCKHYAVHVATSTNPTTEKSQCERERIESLEKQLSVKDQQLEAKDRQIEELIKANKKPKTVHNNRYVVEQHINLFGKESLAHISHEQIQCLLADPENAVAKFVKLKHRAPSNANVRCPNVNRAIYQVVVEGGAEEGGKEWENRAKGEVLEKLYDDNSTILEGEAIEEDHMPFLDHQDKVKASAAANGVDGGKCYKQQLDKIHNVIIS